MRVFHCLFVYLFEVGSRHPNAAGQGSSEKNQCRLLNHNLSRPPPKTKQTHVDRLSYILYLTPTSPPTPKTTTNTNDRYEEGDPSVTDRLVLGYPRFVFHPFVKQLVEVCYCIIYGVCRCIQMNIQMIYIYICPYKNKLDIFMLTHHLPPTPSPLPPKLPPPPQVWKQRAVEAGEVGAHEVVGALPLPSRAAAERWVGGWDAPCILLNFIPLSYIKHIHIINTHTQTTAAAASSSPPTPRSRASLSACTAWGSRGTAPTWCRSLPRPQVRSVWGGVVDMVVEDCVR